MARVKGTLFVNWVKTIRARKDGEYDRFLSADDREIVEDRIIPTGWYPFETYKRCFLAVFELEARSDLAVARRWGRDYGEEIILNVYKKVVHTRTPMETLERYRMIFNLFFDFGTLELEADGDRRAVLTFTEFDPDFEPLYVLIEGWIERSVEMAGADRPVARCLTRSWEGEGPTRLEVTWS